MATVRIAERRIWVDSQSRSLLSGEVHFWRLDPRRWPPVLDQVRDLGLDVLSSYVCWDFHELEPGRFDFRGATDSRRDLIAFVELAQRAGFWVVIRPGPYIYAEWPNSGVPERAVAYHRLHPEFQALAQPYMAAVVEALRPFFATDGGPIVLLQADNEADPWLDVYAQQVGLGTRPGLFQTWLREHYADDIAALNAAWESALENFEQARGVLQPTIRSRGYLNRYLDVCRFRHWYATEVVRWTTRTYRTLGVTVPISANTYAGFTVQPWRQLEAVADLAGPDLYPTAEFRGSPAEHRRLLDAVRATRTYSALPFIPEFEAGIWHGWHARVGVLPPNQYPLVGLSALLAGVAGWNWYMLVGRDSWYMSPISELGQPRPELMASFKQVVDLFRALDPSSLDKLTNTAVTLDVLSQAAQIDDVGEALRDALYQADIDYELYDVETGQIDKPLLLYAGGRWLSQAGQVRLADFVEAGGTLVFFQALPVVDDQLQPLNHLGLVEPDGVATAADPQRLALRMGSETIVLASAAVFSYGAVPGEPLVAERARPRPPSQEGGHRHGELPIGERVVVGYRERRGAGQLILLGLAPEPRMLQALHRWLGVRVASSASTAHVQTAVFRRGQTCFLVAVNAGHEEREVRVWLDPELVGAGPFAVRDLGGGAESRADQVVHVRLQPKCGTVVQLAAPPPG